MSNEPIRKTQIEALKKDPAALSAFFQSQTDGAVAYVLRKFGRLENGDATQPLLRLLGTSDSAKVKSLAIMNLAKMGDASLLATFAGYADEDDSTEVRREAASAIGRLRCPEAIPYLAKLLSDKDPKVVVQAIRGLLVFPRDNGARKELSRLKNHPNESVRALLADNAIKETAQDAAKRTAAGRGAKNTAHPASMENTVVQGDTLATLKHVADESVHLTFTSPPYYNARDYSLYESYRAYLQFLQKVFKQVHRVTKAGRFFVLNTSPIIIPRASRANASRRYPIPFDIHPLLIKMGWEFIDDIVWVKPESAVKNRNAGFAQHRKPLAYKPNVVTEMLMVYRKRADKLIDWNIRQYDAAAVAQSRVTGEYETTNVWRIAPTFDRVHSAVFPLQLCERVIRYYSFVGDLVFDPFAGSGTVGRAAALLRRRFFLTERQPDYVDRMRGFFDKTVGLFEAGDKRPVFCDTRGFAKLREQAVCPDPETRETSALEPTSSMTALPGPS